MIIEITKKELIRLIPIFEFLIKNLKYIPRSCTKVLLEVSFMQLELSKNNTHCRVIKLCNKIK